MKRIFLGCAAMAALVAGGTGVAAQDPQAAATSERRMVRTRQQGSAVRVPLMTKIVKGAPYSAELMIEDVQVLADGNRIVHKVTGRVYRDSEGRTRREEDRAPGQVASVSIVDPVANVSIGLDPESRTAWKTSTSVATAIASRVPGGTQVDPAELERRRAIERELAGATAAGTVVAMPNQGTGTRMIKRSSAAPQWDEKTEVLPARNIEGVMAEGRRVTRTIPAGAIGNEQPIVTVSEEWISNDLQVLVMTKSSDPREGEHTYRLVNITRAEPNAAWFQVPPDYTVRESGVNRLAPAVRR
jgi:hypothetical protein